MKPRRRRALGYETRILLLAAGLVAPFLAAAAILAFLPPLSNQGKLALFSLLGLVLIAGLFALHSNLVYPLRTLSNLLASIRE